MALGDIVGYGGLGGPLGTINQTSALQNAVTTWASAANQAIQSTYIAYQPMNGAFVIGAEPPGALKELKPRLPKWKTAKRAIDRLRMEIEEWHGDILERCPA